MNINTLEERIKVRAKNRMSKEIDIFKRDVLKSLERLISHGYSKIIPCDDPNDIDEEKWGNKEAARETKLAQFLLNSVLRKTFLYPTSLHEIYIQKEQDDLIAMHESFLKISSQEQAREDIQQS